MPFSLINLLENKDRISELVVGGVMVAEVSINGCVFTFKEASNEIAAFCPLSSSFGRFIIDLKIGGTLIQMCVIQD